MRINSGRAKNMLIAVLAVGAAYFAGNNDTSLSTPKTPFCRTTGDSDQKLKVVIFGESWAAKGRLTPELPDTLHRLTGKSVTSCQIGYSGQNTGKQISAFKKDYPDTALRYLFNGEQVDYAVIMTGVNDVVGRRGASTYANDVIELADLLKQSAKHVVVMEIPRIDPSPPASTLSAIKRKAYSLANDHDSSDPVSSYNSMLKGRALNLTIMPYDTFFRGYDIDGDMLLPDRTHLTDQSFHRLGSYIGSQLALYEGQAADITASPTIAQTPAH